jgi:hypothetical protein
MSRFRVAYECVPVPDFSLASQPFAKNAKGWGTERFSWRIGDGA